MSAPKKKPKNKAQKPESKAKKPHRKTPELSRQKRAERAFVKGLLTRGEAACASGGKLPPGATHEIVGEDPDGRPKVVRRRFSTL